MLELKTVTNAPISMQLQRACLSTLRWLIFVSLDVLLIVKSTTFAIVMLLLVVPASFAQSALNSTRYFYYWMPEAVSSLDYRSAPFSSESFTLRSTVRTDDSDFTSLRLQSAPLSHRFELPRYIEVFPSKPSQRQRKSKRSPLTAQTSNHALRWVSWPRVSNLIFERLLICKGIGSCFLVALRCFSGLPPLFLLR